MRIYIYILILSFWLVSNAVADCSYECVVSYHVKTVNYGLDSHAYVYAADTIDECGRITYGAGIGFQDNIYFSNVYLNTYGWNGSSWVTIYNGSGGNSMLTSEVSSFLSQAPNLVSENPLTTYTNGCSDVPKCLPEKALAALQCDGEDNVEWSLFDEETCSNIVCKPSCEELRAAKEVECGGAEYLEDWDTSTCTGNCYCDAEDETEYIEMRNFCGSAAKTVYDKETCTGRCGDCMEEYIEFEDGCLQAGLVVKTFDYNNCTGTCSDDCSALYILKEQECLPYNVINWDNKTCTGDCEQDCSVQYESLEEKCGIVGIKSFNNADCTGVCNDCEARKVDCNSKCAGQVADYECNDKHYNGTYIALDETGCYCGSPDQLLGGDVPVILGPGSGGGTLTNNPDGSITELLGDGTKITYSGDGKTARVDYPDGRQYRQEINNDGSMTYYVIDENGNYRKQTVVYKDGMQVVLSDENGKLENNEWVDIKDVEKEYKYEIVDNGDGTETIRTIETVYNEDGTETVSESEKTQESGENIAQAPDNKLLVKKGYQSADSYAWQDRIDFAKWDAAKAKFAAHSPATIYDNSIGPLFDEFNIEGETPNFEVQLINSSVIGAHSVSFDLSAFDTFMIVWRFLVGCYFLFLTLNRVVVVWGGN